MTGAPRGIDTTGGTQTSGVSVDGLSAAQAALDAGDWRLAAAKAEAALAQSDSADGHLVLAVALWCGYEIDRAIVAMKAAYQRFVAESRFERAGFLAGWIAVEELMTRGNPAVARGWLQRGRRLFEDRRSCAEYGWFLLWESGFDGGVQALATATASAMEIARDCGDVDLEIECRAVQGLAAVQLGNVDEGMALLDEAMAAVTGGETSSPLVVGDCFCFVLGACQQVGDYARAEEWCRVGLRASDARANGFLKASCLASFGWILATAGKWTESETRLREALGLFKSGHKRLQPEALIKLADLRRRQARLGDARRFLQGIERSPGALRTLAEIALDEEDNEQALELARELHRLVQGGLVTEQVVALQLLVRAAAGLGTIQEAQAAMDELETRGLRVTTDCVMGATWLARGALLRARGEPDQSASAYAEAACLFVRARAPFEAAHAQLAQAAALREAGDAAEAQRLAHQAGEQLQRLRESNRGEWLSPREQEVVGLLAGGLSNAAIATHLGLSTHTVHRHVANVLQKLNAPTRAAAVAEAARRRIV